MAPSSVEPGPKRLCHWSECRSNDRRYGIDLADIDGTSAAHRSVRMTDFFAYHGTMHPGTVASIFRRGRDATCEALHKKGARSISQEAFDFLAHQRAWAAFFEEYNPQPDFPWWDAAKKLKNGPDTPRSEVYGTWLARMGAGSSDQQGGGGQSA
ncbi:hypothetical protein TPAR_07564, partial [Tolypocladium paradoxum]